MLSSLKNAFVYVPSAMEDLEKLKCILSFETAFEYQTELCAWMDRLSNLLAEDLETRNTRKIRAAVEYIDEHFRSRINMAVVSNYISMNYTQFSSLFKQHTGSGFSDYLRDLRLAESKRLLADESISIQSVREMSGFNSKKRFIECFKMDTGIVPGEYRQYLIRKRERHRKKKSNAISTVTFC